ncbi:hypothetical protein I553_4547 [Mycobacterium xenopi 4042]|uniref:Uncharacterized protein n=1 Tax=Mycobacterium xenopi 4042 TaxID=1299334 RepID=X8AHH3_MYCXE|nr:hypothetical protein I553_4547 [Mycobacterium xenopi 4042]
MTDDIAAESAPAKPRRYETASAHKSAPISGWPPTGCSPFTAMRTSPPSRSLPPLVFRRAPSFAISPAKKSCS